MLFALVPPALILAPVCPVVYTVAFLFIVQVLAIVPDAIGVNIDSVPAHVVVGPLAVVFAPVSPQVSPEAVDLVVDPLAFVGATVSPGVATQTLLTAHHVVAFERSSLRPSFMTFAVLKIVLPLAFVPRISHVDVDSPSVSFVIGPLSLISVSISVENLPFSTSLIELPLTFVAAAIWPDHRSIAKAHATTPLACVNRTILVIVSPLLQRQGSVVRFLGQSLLRFFGLKVLAHALGVELHHSVLPAHQEASNPRLHSAYEHSLVHFRFFLLNCMSSSKENLLHLSFCCRQLLYQKRSFELWA